MLLTGDSSFQQEAEFYPDNDMFQYLGDLYNVVRFDCQNASIEKALLDIKEVSCQYKTLPKHVSTCSYILNLSDVTGIVQCR